MVKVSDLKLSSQLSYDAHREETDDLEHYDSHNNVDFLDFNFTANVKSFCFEEDTRKNYPNGSEYSSSPESSISSDLNLSHGSSDVAPSSLPHQITSIFLQRNKKGFQRLDSGIDSLSDSDKENEMVCKTELKLCQKSDAAIEINTNSVSCNDAGVISSSLSSYSDLLADICSNDSNDKSSSDSFLDYITNENRLSSSFGSGTLAGLSASNVGLDEGTNLTDLLSSIHLEEDSCRSSVWKNETPTGSNDVSPRWTGGCSVESLDGKFKERENREVSLAELATQYLSSSQPSDSFEKNVSRSSDEIRQNSQDRSTENISMLDLLSSANMENVLSFDNDVIRNDALSNDEMDFCIDLTSCLKSGKKSPQSEPLLPVHGNQEDVYFEGLNFNFFNSPMSQIIIEKESILKPRQMNVKQSLFSKSLSCKMQKNSSSISKVRTLQNSICGKLFSRPSEELVPRNPVKNRFQSSHCISATVGRRIFGPGVPCELI